jgi:peptidyl-prolyl cis-trans isomerase SurA
MSPLFSHLGRGTPRRTLLALSALGLTLVPASLACAQTDAPPPADAAGGGLNLGLPTDTQDAPVAPAPGAAAAPHTRPPLSETVAALVNDDPISSYDLRQRMRLLVATTGVQPTEDTIPQIEREALRGLIDERLEMQEVRAIEKKQKDLHLEPEESEIDGDIADIAKQSGITERQLLSTLKSDGVDATTLREQIRAQMAWNHYIGARFRDSVVIADNQVDSALERADSASLKPQYELSEIFLDASHVGGQQVAEDGAKQLIAQMKQGAPFSSVARQFSALPTAANGGDAGWVTDSELSPELRAAVEQMHPGDLSQPIPVSNGVYIVQLRQKKAGSSDEVVDLKQAAVSLDADASPEQVAKAQAKLVALRKRIKSCTTLEEQADHYPGVISGDLGETAVNELRPAFRQAVDSLHVNEVSPPIRTDVGLHLIAVCSRHARGVEGVTRADITDRLRGEQLSMFARRYLRDLRNSAEIETK